MKKLNYFLYLTVLMCLFSAILPNALNATNSNCSNLHKFYRSPSGTSSRIVITLNRHDYSSGYSNVDGAVIVFDSSFSKSIGPEDSKKLSNGGENLALFESNSQLSIDGLPNPVGGDSIFIEMWQLQNDSTYKLELDLTLFNILTPNTKGFILDRYLSTKTALNVDSNMVIFVPKANTATYLLRYVIYFRTSITHIVNLSGCNQYTYKGITYTSSTTVRDTIKSKIDVFDSIYNITNIVVTPIVAATNNITFAGCNSVVYKGTTYTSSVILKDTIKSVQGCDSIYNVANIVVTPIVATTINVTFKGCNSIIYKGSTYTTSTIIKDTVKSIQGCDSIYNIAALTITPIVPTNNNIHLAACNKITYKGNIYTTSTTIKDTVKSVQGCDSIYNTANIVITPIVAVTNNIHLSGCNSIVYKGNTYTTSSLINDTLKSVQGCDSVYNLANIVITPIVSVTKNILLSGCNSVVYKGFNYTSSAILKDTLKSVQGCDSIYNVANIVVTPILAVTKNISFNGCNSIIYKGTTYTSSTTIKDSVKSIQGCDSIYNITTLIITPIVATNNNIYLTGCNSIVYKGNVYTTSSIAKDTLKSVQGCDSIYNTANIVITPIAAVTKTIILSGCNNVVYKGINYNASAIIKDTLKSIQGCDSIYNVANIYITPIVPVTQSLTYSGCDSVRYIGILYKHTIVLYDTIKSTQGCDSVFHNVHIDITTPSTPSVSLGSTSIVANGSSVTFTATALNGGVSPTYTFKVNSVIVQTGTSNTYSSSTLHVGDSVSCTIISHASCITDSIAKSNTIVMTTNVPLTLIGFQADRNGTNTNCTWQTTAEVNTAYFIVQRSTNGIEFTNQNTIKAKGISTEVNTYNCVDAIDKDLKNIPAIYYRLQIVDKDGHFSYSKIVRVNLISNNEFSIYPNPAKELVKISGKDINTVQITDINGRILILKNNINSDFVSIDIRDLSKGVYLINILSKSGSKLINKLLID